MTTYAAFTAAVSGASITGVTRQYTYAPDALSTADLPASWIRLPGGGTNLGTLASQCSNTGATRAVELVVCLEPVNQDTTSANHAAAITMMDNVETALDALGAHGAALGNVILEYTLAGQGVIVGGVPFWSVVAAVRMTE